MTTTYIHKRTSVATNEPTASIPSGELVVNLSSGKLRTTRVITEGTFVGTVASATANTITLESDVPAFLPLRAVTTTLRSTTSDTINNAPAISTATFGSVSTVETNVINIALNDDGSDSLKGNIFNVGDFIWAETGADVVETIVLSGQTTAGPISPPDALRGDIWIDTSAATGTPVVMIYDGTDGIGFVLFEPDTGGGGGSGAFETADLSIQTQPSDSDTNDMDFGLINSLPADGNTALGATYSAVDYNFGGIRSPRPGPDFGVLS